MHATELNPQIRSVDQTTRVNLGCPKKCLGWTCVDRRGVPSLDVYDWLEHRAKTGDPVYEIRTKNLLEHLPDVGRFLALCNQVLSKGGRLDLITDNAEFLPFYFPFWIRHTGIGAHAVNQYALDNCDSAHFAIFTAMHLKNLMKWAGFRSVTVARVTLGARLLARGFK